MVQNLIMLENHLLSFASLISQFLFVTKLYLFLNVLVLLQGIRDTCNFWWLLKI